MSINYKYTPIQLKNGKVSLLEEFDSVNLPVELINLIYSFMPIHPITTMITDIVRKSIYCDILPLSINGPEYFYIKWQQYYGNRDKIHKNQNLFKQNILVNFLRKYDDNNFFETKVKSIKFGTKTRFEASKKDYIKRKKALVRK